MLLTIIVFIFILGLLVFVHELGHFVVAKKMGVAVEEFGIGFPPRALSIKRGETTYSLNWVPLGGFVKIKGENGEFTNEPDSFASKKIWQRSLILASGVTMNALLTVVLISLGFMTGLPQVIENVTENYAQVRNKQVQVYNVNLLLDSPAKKADLRMGDSILAFNGEKIENINQLKEKMAKNEGQAVNLTIKRGGEILNKEVRPEKLTIGQEQVVGVGIALAETALVSYPWYIAIYKGFLTTINLIVIIVLAFYEAIKGLIIGQPLAVEVAGPVGIAALTGQVVNLGLIYVLQFTALLSLNLAIINFLPFPALDGGRVLFIIIEKIRGRAVSQKLEAMIHNIGFAILMILILLITFRDISRFQGQFLNVFHKLSNFF
jgi:regulator of sigma E protease